MEEKLTWVKVREKYFPPVDVEKIRKLLGDKNFQIPTNIRDGIYSLNGAHHFSCSLGTISDLLQRWGFDSGTRNFSL